MGRCGAVELRQNTPSWCASSKMGTWDWELGNSTRADERGPSSCEGVSQGPTDARGEGGCAERETLVELDSGIGGITSRMAMGWVKSAWDAVENHFEGVGTGVGGAPASRPSRVNKLIVPLKTQHKKNCEKGKGRGVIALPRWLTSRLFGQRFHVSKRGGMPNAVERGPVRHQSREACRDRGVTSSGGRIQARVAVDDPALVDCQQEKPSIRYEGARTGYDSVIGSEFLPWLPKPVAALAPICTAMLTTWCVDAGGWWFMSLALFAVHLVE